MTFDHKTVTGTVNKRKINENIANKKYLGSRLTEVNNKKKRTTVGWELT